MAKGIVVDVKTGKVKTVEYDFKEDTNGVVDEVKIDLNDLRKLINYAKNKGWI